MERCPDDQSSLRGTDSLTSRCINCPWYVSETESAVLYVTNEIVRVTGVATSSPEPNTTAMLRFMYRQAVVESLVLQAGQTLGFTMVGMDRIEVIGMGAGDSMGNLMIDSVKLAVG